MLGAFTAHIARCPPARRIAVVTGSSVIRMQVRRVFVSAIIQPFEERGAAIDWLMREHYERAGAA